MSDELDVHYLGMSYGVAAAQNISSAAMRDAVVRGVDESGPSHA